MLDKQQILQIESDNINTRALLVIVKKYNCKIYQCIRDNGGWENWNMIEIEKYPCNDGNEARKRERYWYETLGASLNVCLPSRSHKEYYTENKEKIEKYCKENKEMILIRQLKYREKNKDIMNSKSKEKYELNKEEMHIRQAEFRNQNREKLRERDKEFRIKHKEKLKIDKKELFICECGDALLKTNKSRHIKSLKHLDKLNSFLNEEIKINT